MIKLCFASNNAHKLEEVRHLTHGEFEILSLAEINCNEELPETQTTLEGNSLQKADFVYSNYKISCFADDTGLEVEALGGEPGVYSARYAGLQRNSEDNIRLLLQKLLSKENRKARFRTIITGIGFGSAPVVFEGVINGVIADTQKGSNGFGYDPIFIPDGYNKTFAQMDMEEKNLVSHRALALKKLAIYLKSLNSFPG